MAGKRVTETAAPLIPDNPTIGKLRRAAAKCQACPLWEKGTQTVFGEGAADAEVVLVGEQPGDREDLEGHPFVGPAGRVLGQALEEAGIDRGSVYITNAVKHFKWEPMGKRRLHKKPNAREIAACRPWLDAELDVLNPEIVVALGATAAQGLMGRDFRVTRSRGELLDFRGDRKFLATLHPSSILRAPSDRRELERARMIHDLRVVGEWLRKRPPSRRFG